MSEVNQTGTSPLTTTRKPCCTSNEDIRSDHIRAKNQSSNNNNIAQNGNPLTSNSYTLTIFYSSLMNLIDD